MFVWFFFLGRGAGGGRGFVDRGIGNGYGQTKVGRPKTGALEFGGFSLETQLVDSNLSRAEVEAKALATAETFTIEGGCELPSPPKEMLMNGLFVLLLETDTVIDMTFVQDPKACMAIFTSMEIIGTLRNSLVATFGQWYLYPTRNVHLPFIHV